MKICKQQLFVKTTSLKRNMLSFCFTPSQANKCFASMAKCCMRPRCWGVLSPKKLAAESSNISFTILVGTKSKHKIINFFKIDRRSRKAQFWFYQWPATSSSWQMFLFYFPCSWDEWVDEKRILKYISINLRKQRELKRLSEATYGKGELSNRNWPATKPFHTFRLFSISGSVKDKKIRFEWQNCCFHANINSRKT